MKRLFYIILCITAVSAMCGCNKIEEAPAMAEVSETETVTEITIPDYPVELNGEPFDKAPERIVCLSPAFTEILFELGYGDSVIGRGSYCDYPPEVLDIPDTGSSVNPDISLIIAADPEIVITESPVAKKDITDLNDSGIRVISVSPPQDIYDIYDIYYGAALLMSGANNAEVIARGAVNDMYTAAENIHNSAGSFIYIMNSNMSVATGDTFTGRFMSLFGENIAEEHTGYYIPEEDIKAADPDLIFLSKDVDGEKFREDFSELSAVKNKRILRVDTSLLERPTSRLEKMITGLDEALEKYNSAE